MNALERDSLYDRAEATILKMRSMGHRPRYWMLSGGDLAEARRWLLGMPVEPVNEYTGSHIAVVHGESGHEVYAPMISNTTDGGEA